MQLAVAPNVDSEQIQLFEYAFEENRELFAVSTDMKSVFKVVQMGGLESSNNSFFLGETVISDGKMLGLIPFLPGWFFLNLYAESKSARSVFITISDVLTEHDERHEQRSHVLAKILEASHSSIESFLSQFMSNQANYENVIGFRWEEDKIVSYLVNMIQSVNKDENFDASHLKINAYFSVKWNEHIVTNARSILLIENLSCHLPANLIKSVLKELNIAPLSENEINKRLSSAKDTIVKQIASGSSLKCTDDLDPTEDYSILDKNKKQKTATKLPSSIKNGQTTMFAFFKKSQ